MKDEFKRPIAEVFSVSPNTVGYRYTENRETKTVVVVFEDYGASLAVTYANLEALASILGTKNISVESNDLPVSEVTPDLWRRVEITAWDVDFPE